MAPGAVSGGPRMAEAQCRTVFGARVTPRVRPFSLPPCLSPPSSSLPLLSFSPSLLPPAPPCYPPPPFGPVLRSAHCRAPPSGSPQGQGHPMGGLRQGHPGRARAGSPTGHVRRAAVRVTPAAHGQGHLWNVAASGAGSPRPSPGGACTGSPPAPRPGRRCSRSFRSLFLPHSFRPSAVHPRHTLDPSVTHLGR